MFFRRKRPEQAYDSEIQYHLDRAAQSYMAQGMAPAEAHRRARLEFGGATQIQEELRDVLSRHFRHHGVPSVAAHE